MKKNLTFWSSLDTNSVLVDGETNGKVVTSEINSVVAVEGGAGVGNMVVVVSIGKVGVGMSSVVVAFSVDKVGAGAGVVVVIVLFG